MPWRSENGSPERDPDGSSGDNDTAPAEKPEHSALESSDESLGKGSIRDKGLRLSVDRETALALLGALCLFLSTVEYMIPKPVPFFRLGLANLPIILALSILDKRGVLLLVVVKVVGQGMVNGTLFSYVFLFSAAGSLASGIVMLMLYHLLGRHISYVGISVSGALASNCAQIGLSYMWIFGYGTILAAPFLLGIGLVSAVILGVLAQRFRAESRWIRRLESEIGIHAGASNQDVDGNPSAPGQSSPSSRVRRSFFTAVDPRLRLLIGLLLLPAFALQPATPIRGIEAIGFIFLSVAAGRSFKPLFPLGVFLAVLFANVLLPVGTVIFRIGTFPVTAGAVETGVSRGAFFIGLVYLSRFSIARGLTIPGRFGSLIGKVFFYFEHLTEAKSTIRIKRFLASIDRLLVEMCEYYPSIKTESGNQAGSGTTHTRDAKRHTSSTDKRKDKQRSRNLHFGLPETILLVCLILVWGLLFRSQLVSMLEML